MSGPTAAQCWALGTQIHRAIATRMEGGTKWPLRLELEDHKKMLVVYDDRGTEVFRIHCEGMWL